MQRLILVGVAVLMIGGCDMSSVLGLVEEPPPQLDSFRIDSSQHSVMVRDAEGEVNNEDGVVNLELPEQVLERGVQLDAEVEVDGDDDEVVWDGPYDFNERVFFDVRQGDRWRSFEVVTEVDSATVVQLSVDSPKRVTQSLEEQIAALDVEVSDVSETVEVMLEYGEYLEYENDMLAFEDWSTQSGAIIDGNSVMRMRDGWDWPYTVEVWSADADYSREYDMRLAFAISDSTNIREIRAHAFPIVEAVRTVELTTSESDWDNAIDGLMPSLSYENQRIDSRAGVTSSSPTVESQNILDLEGFSVGGNSIIRGGDVDEFRQLIAYTKWIDRGYREQVTDWNRIDAREVEISSDWTNEAEDVPTSGVEYSDPEGVDYATSGAVSVWHSNNVKWYGTGKSSFGGYPTAESEPDYENGGKLRDVSGLISEGDYGFESYEYSNSFSDEIRLRRRGVRSLKTSNRSFDVDERVTEETRYDITDARDFYSIEYIEVEADPGGRIDSISLIAATEYEEIDDGIVRFHIPHEELERTAPGDIASFDIVAQNDDRERHTVSID